MSNPDRTPPKGAHGAVVRLDLAGAADATRDLAPASVLLRFDDPSDAHAMVSRVGAALDDPPPALGVELLALDTPPAIDSHSAGADARRMACPEAVLLPAMVNAHTHLDLSGLGPIALETGTPEESFEGWLGQIRDRRPRTASAIQAAVELGVRLSLASGVRAVGDIAGAVGPQPRGDAIHALRASPLQGVGYLEFFAIGAGERERLDRVRAAVDELPPHRTGFRPGLQPHAPYSASRAAYAWAVERAAALRLPLSTHLAETRAERRFVAEGVGPRRAFLESLGLWNDDLERDLAHGASPIEHLEPVLRGARASGVPVLAAHVADASDGDLQRLAECGASVAYCPRAAEFFGTPADLGPHRYRDMLSAGINVCLGTDSVAGLPPEASRLSAGAFGPLSEARRLYQRDAVDPATLLAMATTHGAIALGLDPAAFTLAPGGRPSGLALCRTSVATSAAVAVLEADSPSRFLCVQNDSG